MTINTETRTVTIALRRYAGSYNPNLEPDVFSELETDFVTGRAQEDGGWAFVATDAEVDDLIDWWIAEVGHVNKGLDGDCLAALTKEELAGGVRWVFDVNETSV